MNLHKTGTSSKNVCRITSILESEDRPAKHLTQSHTNLSYLALVPNSRNQYTQKSEFSREKCEIKRLISQLFNALTNWFFCMWLCLHTYPWCPRFSKRPKSREGARRQEVRGEKTSDCPRQLIDLTAPIDLKQGQDLTLPPDWRNLTAYRTVFWLAVVNWQVCCYWLLVSRSHDVNWQLS